MTRNKTIALAAFTIFLLVGCETNRIVFEGPYFVQFTTTAESKLESYSKIISLEVHNGGPALQEDLTINYTISGTARENIDYKIIGTRGKLTIPKGEFTTTLQFKLINNSNNILRSQFITFTLSDTDNPARQIGFGESKIGSAFTFTINDDCILGGTYLGEPDALHVPIQNITISSPDCDAYTLSNWNVYYFNDPTAHSLTFFDNGDNTLQIPRQHDPLISDTTFYVSGNGIVDPSTRQIGFDIKLEIVIDDTLRTDAFEFQLIPD